GRSGSSRRLSRPRRGGMVDSDVSTSPRGKSMPLAAGTHLGPYVILGPLGTGGMGEVYRAQDSRLHRDVAVKVLPEEFAKSASAMVRFQEEARAEGGPGQPDIPGPPHIRRDIGNC